MDVVYEVILIETVGEVRREIKFLSLDDFLKYDNQETNYEE